MWLFVVIFVLAGIGLLIAGHKMQLASRNAESWPTVPGHLERCGVIERPGTRPLNPSTWHLDLLYSYTVKGVAYKSSTYAFGYGDGRDSAPHQIVADQLARSPELTVSYNPNHPSQAVLTTIEQPNLTMLGYASLAMALISMLIALAVS